PRAGTSWAIAPSGTEAQVQHWRDIHALQADIFRRGIAAGVFIDEDPAYLARLFSALDQVLLADWVASGMKAERDALVRRLRSQVERSFRRARRARHAASLPRYFTASGLRGDAIPPATLRGGALNSHSHTPS